MRRATLRLSITTIMTALILATAGVGTAHADQPHMYGARNDLQQAVFALQAAQDDKGGRRVDAINLAQQAIDEVNLGIQFAGGPPDGFFVAPPPPIGPAMNNANAYLQLAADELRAAEDNKGGHRIAALNLTEQAIDQVNQGIQIGGPF
jgi:hypothetical protein